MASTIADRFNIEVLQLIAILYESHPRQMTVEMKDVSSNIQAGSGTADDEAYTIGTFSWLIDNGFVVGEVNRYIGELQNSQLTASAWATLQRQEPNSSVQPLAEAVLAAAKQGGREASIVGDILMRRLTGS